jgi:hypothetical protein
LIDLLFGHVIRFCFDMHMLNISSTSSVPSIRSQSGMVNIQFWKATHWCATPHKHKFFVNEHLMLNLVSNTWMCTLPTWGGPISCCHVNLYSQSWLTLSLMEEPIVVQTCVLSFNTLPLHLLACLYPQNSVQRIHCRLSQYHLYSSIVAHFPHWADDVDTRSGQMDRKLLMWNVVSHWIKLPKHVMA